MADVAEAPQTPETVASAVEAMTRARAELEAAVGDTEHALQEWGVRPDHPEAKFFRMMMTLLRKTGDLLVLAGQSHDRTDHTFRTAEQQLRFGVATMERSVETRVAAVKGDVDKIMAQAIERFSGEFAKAAHTWMYVRERRWSQAQLMKMALGGALVLALAVGCGYVWRYGQDNTAMNGRYLCEQAPMIVNTPQGNVLACRLSGLIGGHELRGLAARWGAVPR